LTTAASLRERTRDELVKLAQKHGVSRWRTMRKEQLVKALLRVRKPAAVRRTIRPPAKTGNGVAHGSKNGARTKTAAKSKPSQRLAAGRRPAQPKSPARAASVVPRARKKSPQVMQRIQSAHAERERLKNLAPPSSPAQKHPIGDKQETNGKTTHRASARDRIVVMVRDSYWLHAYWEVRPQSVERVRVAMSEQWHTARPVLRLIEVDAGATTSTAEHVAREIDIHGGVDNWYIDVMDPPKSYRVDIGYRGGNGRFFSLARSNSVTTPRPGSSDALDQNWSEVAKDYEKVYALSGGYSDGRSLGDLKDVFEERLRRPMGSPLTGHYGMGAEGLLDRRSAFSFDVDAELIVYGRTKPGSRVTLAGQPIRLRPDGSFAVRKSLPDRRQVLPVVADSGDGLEQRTIILAVERNTKVMEPVTRETGEQQP